MATDLTIEVVLNEETKQCIDEIVEQARQEEREACIKLVKLVFAKIPAVGVFADKRYTAQELFGLQKIVIDAIQKRGEQGGS